MYVYAGWQQICVHKASMFAVRCSWQSKRLLVSAPPPFQGARIVLWCGAATSAHTPRLPPQDLAAEYHCERLGFGMFPIDRWSGMAKELNVDMQSFASLPSIILYDGGAEVARVPRLLIKGGVAKGAWGKADVLRALELGKYKGDGGEGSSSSGGALEKKKKR